ncbi:MAG: ArsR/SmtB family transcription factor [Planctomycetota bacterium]
MSAKVDRVVDRAFAALGDPTRRAVIERLRRGPQRAGRLAAALDVSPPALSRHLRVLRGSDLVEALGDDGDARARVYRLRREPFVRLRDWAAAVESLWSEQLESFAAHVARTRGGKDRP